MLPQLLLKLLLEQMQGLKVLQAEPTHFTELNNDNYS